MYFFKANIMFTRMYLENYSNHMDHIHLTESSNNEDTNYTKYQSKMVEFNLAI